jgi:hypothetical protein
LKVRRGRLRTRATVEVVKPRVGEKCLRTTKDGTPTDNLLYLPRR